jgi:hypothetical protein
MKSINTINAVRTANNINDHTIDMCNDHPRVKRDKAAPVIVSFQKAMVRENLHYPFLTLERKSFNRQIRRKRVFLVQQTKEVQKEMFDALLELERYETDSEENQVLYDEKIINRGAWVRQKVEM